MTLRLHISDHNDNLHNTTAKRNIAGGVAGLNGSGKIDRIYLDSPVLTLALFKTNPATGTGTTVRPEKINDGLTGGLTMYFTNVDDTLEIDLTHNFFIKEYRIWGSMGNNGDGKSDLEYLNAEDIWTPLTVVTTRNTNTWSDWIILTPPIFTQKIRMVATIIDTGGYSFFYEMEMR